MHAYADFQWVGVDDGGRPSGPPIGKSYFPTVVFADDPNQSHFSVEMTFDRTGGAHTDAQLRFFALELADQFVKPGASFQVMEGPTVVGSNGTIRVVPGMSP